MGYQIGIGWLAAMVVLSILFMSFVLVKLWKRLVCGSVEFDRPGESAPVQPHCATTDPDFATNEQDFGDKAYRNRSILVRWAVRHLREMSGLEFGTAAELVRYLENKAEHLGFESPVDVNYSGPDSQNWSDHFTRLENKIEYLTAAHQNLCDVVNTWDPKWPDANSILNRINIAEKVLGENDMQLRAGLVELNRNVGLMLSLTVAKPPVSKPKIKSKVKKRVGAK